MSDTIAANARPHLEPGEQVHGAVSEVELWLQQVTATWEPSAT